METPETLLAELAAMLAPNARGNVMTLGLARVWFGAKGIARR